MSTPTPLFFDPAIGPPRVAFATSDLASVAVADTLDFPDERGGDVDRELGLPLLPGMDEVQVDRAELSLGAGDKQIDATFAARQAGDGNGTFFSLSAPARLLKLDISYTLPPGVTGTVRTVLRAAAPQGSGFAAGVPLFSQPDFPPPGPMFPRVLTGMTVSDHGAHKTVTVPSVLGSAWMVQIATGDSIDTLAPIAVAPTINAVTIAAFPTNLGVSLPDEGVTLWNHPGLLLPEVGEQAVSFLPMAQKHLAAALKGPAGSPGSVALSLPLKFHSDSACAVEVFSKRLQGRYVVRPLASDPTIVKLRGGWEDLTLQAPAGLRPTGSALRISAKLLGRELNAGSPDPPLDEPSAGLRVNPDRAAAVSRTFLPPAGQAAGGLLALVSLRLYLGAPSAAEAVVELRNDAAGAPGASVGTPVVRQLLAGTSGWVEFDLTRPLSVRAGGAPLWVVLRSTRGDVLWYVGPAGASPPRVSADRGGTWGVPDPVFAPVGDPLALLFHASPDAPVPVVLIRDSGGIVGTNLLPDPAPKAPRQFVSDGAALPDAVLARLASAGGEGRVPSRFRVFSRSALDLSIEALRIFYDPFAARGGA